MPAIPRILSSEPYAVQPKPLADPRSAGLAAATLAQGMAQVANQFARVAEVAGQQQAVAQASEFGPAIGQWMTDTRLRYADDPEPGTAPQRFQAEAQARRAQMLDGIQDERVRGYVTRMFDQHAETAYAEVARTAYRRVHVQSLERVSQAQSDQAKLFGSAPNLAAEQLAVQGIKAPAAGLVATGAMSEAEAARSVSTALRAAIMLRAGADPLGAQAALERWRGDLQAGDLLAVQEHIRGPLERRQAEDAAQAAIAMPSDVAARARQVFDGFVALGWPEAAAWGFAANAVQESGARPNVPAGDGGRSRGTFQWNAERLAAYRAKYGHDPEQGSLAEHVEFLDHELRTTEAQHAQAIRAAATPAEAARLISTRLLRPRDTAIEEPRRAAIAERLAARGPGSLPPDVQAQVEEARRRTAGLPVHVQERAVGLVIEHNNRLQAGQAVERAELGRALEDLQATYEAGITTAAIPEDRIHALFPPEQAFRAIEGLRVTHQAGELFRAVQWATPEEESAARAALDVTAAGEAPDRARLRQQVAARYETLVARKRQALEHDPAAYAASHPLLAEKAAALRAAPGDTAAWEDYGRASLALQARLGVPEARRRVLTSGQAADIAARLARTDPTKEDMGAVLDATARQYGALWPQVWGDLVTVGKVSPDWQVLASMTTSAQAVARQDLQRALMLRTQKGGLEELRSLAPPAELKVVRDRLDDTIEPFRATVRHNEGGLRLLNTVRDAVQTLALYYAVQGRDGGDALEAAYQAIIGARYDIDGTMRVPKGQLRAVRASTTTVQQNLAAADLQPIPDATGLRTPAEIEAVTLQAARRGFWVPNEDDTGLVLMLRLRDGAAIPALRRDGGRVAVRFDALPPARVPGGPPLDLMGSP